MFQMKHLGTEYEALTNQTGQHRLGAGSQTYRQLSLVDQDHWMICVDTPRDQLHLGNNVGRKEGNVLFNDALNTFYLRLYGVRHMVKDHIDSEGGNPLLPHRLLFLISSKGSFICIIPQTG